MSWYDALGLAFYLVAGHALGDRGLQPSNLSSGKRRDLNPGTWWQYLLAHGLIHGLIVAVITHIWILGVLETWAHMEIDRAKGRGKITNMTDQILHMVCKLVWWCIVVLASYA